MADSEPSDGRAGITIGILSALVAIIIATKLYILGSQPIKQILPYVVRFCYIVHVSMILQQFGLNPNPFGQDGFKKVDIPAAAPQVFQDVGDAPQISLHPVFMSVAFAICMTEAVMAYRTGAVLLNGHQTQKKFHAVFNFFALIFATVGFAVVVNFRHKIATAGIASLPDFNSVHSVLGFTVYMAIIAQWFTGLYFFYISTNADFKKRMIQLHRPFGFVIWLTTMMTMMTGLVNVDSGPSRGRWYGPQGKINGDSQRGQTAALFLWSVAAFVYVIIQSPRPDHGHGKDGKAGMSGMADPAEIHTNHDMHTEKMLAGNDTAYAAMDS